MPGQEPLDARDPFRNGVYGVDSRRFAGEGVSRMQNLARNLIEDQEFLFREKTDVRSRELLAAGRNLLRWVESRRIKLWVYPLDPFEDTFCLPVLGKGWKHRCVGILVRRK